jgi:hypothetical protein
VTRVHKVTREIKVHMVLLEKKETRVTRVTRATKVLQVMLVFQVIKVLQEFLVLKEIKEFKDQWATEDQKVCRVVLVKKVKGVHTDHKEKRD